MSEVDPDIVSFRRLAVADLAKIYGWLHLPHVARWWHEDLGSFGEVSERYSAYIEGRDPVKPYLILYGERPIGYIQSYRVSDDEEYDALIGVENSAGIDLFIGEEAFLYRGLGAGIIHRFLEEFVFSDGDLEVCVIDPEPKNKAAIRAYEKAGFRHFESVETPEGPAYLMKLPRTTFFGG